MKEQVFHNYSRIAEIIEFLQQDFKENLSFDEIAKKAHLIPSQFHKLFIDWAGVSPEVFLEFISAQYAKNILNNSASTILETTNNAGLLGTARYHDSFVQIEAMTSGEYKNEGENLTINYSFSESIFGRVLVASTHQGICYMGFSDDEQIAFLAVKKRFPKASFTHKMDDIQHNALQIYSQDRSKIKTIKLYVKGTGFQVSVWKALLKIPMGKLTSYGDIAEIIQKPKAARAVGTAIGSNPIAFIIPCHRVIQSSGIFGGYMWGRTRKTAMIAWEAFKVKASEINS